MPTPTSARPRGPDLSAHDLAALRAALHDHRRARRDQLDALACRTHAVDELDAVVKADLVAGAHSALTLIEEAITRLDEGTYGRCLRCWSAIPQGRLHAVPHARYCLDCAA